MPKINSVLKNVSNKLKPSKEKRKDTEYFAAELLNLARRISESHSVVPMMCGSVSKDTWLPDKNELDMFLLFKPSVSRNKLEELGLKLARDIIEDIGGVHEKRYSEHPYLCGTIKFGKTKFSVDIVPCYDIKNLKKIKSAVDRTPHHVRYVKSKLSEPNEARLLKQFMKASGCYGADVKVNGFSGYLCELLIIKYGSFLKCIKAASKWRTIRVITMSKINKELLLNKFRTPLIVIDPVDVNRNVAAAVSPESFYKFVAASRTFIDNPSEKFFLPRDNKPYTVTEISKEINKRGTRWYMIKFNRPKIVDDILYPQMKRCSNSVEKILTRAGFSVLRKDFYIGDACVFVFEMDTWQVPSISKNIGPNVYDKHAEDFLKHYKARKTFVEGDNWVVELDRKFITALHLLKDLTNSSDKTLKEKGIPSKISSYFRKSHVVSGSDALKLVKALPADFRIFMREWFEKDIEIV